MSLNRLALRLGTVLALTNNDASPYPTMAEGRVFDSRLDPMQIVEGQSRQPYAIVYTDDDAGDGLSANNGGPPWYRKLDLAIHFAVAAHGVITNPDTGEEIDGFGPIETDAEVEALLDLFEYQIERALFGLGSWSTQFKKLILRATDRSSVRFGDPQNVSVRYTERMVIYKIDMLDDWIDDTRLAAISPASPTPLPEHIQNLVTAVAAAMPPGSAYVSQTVATIQAAGLPGIAALEAFEGLRVIEDERDAQGRRTNPRSQGDEPGIAHITLPTD